MIKEKAGSAFAQNQGGYSSNDQIITGSVIEGRVVDETPDGSGGKPSYALQFWIKLDLLPDAQPALSSAQQNEEQDVTIDTDCGVVSLMSPQAGEKVMERLDKVMLYLFATRGIDNAVLTRNDGKPALQDSEMDTMYAAQALDYAIHMITIVQDTQSNELTLDSLHRVVSHFMGIMEVGSCTKLEKSNTLCFPTKFALSADTDDEDDESEQDAAVNYTHPEALLEDIMITYSPDDRIIEMHYENADEQPCSSLWKANGMNVLEMLAELWEVMKDRGLARDSELMTFIHAYHIVRENKPMEALIQELLPKKSFDPAHDAAMRAFFQAETPIHAIN